ncbi:MAG: hypothetical protein RL169_1701 [Armatimonadota bacterium]|jgi:predicted transcriptional regulator
MLYIQVMSNMQAGHHNRFLPHRTGVGSPLGDLEEAVMKVVWNQSTAVSVTEIKLSLENVAYTTIKTTVERLTEKGILQRVRDGKAYRYEAILSEAGLQQKIVNQMLERLVTQFPNAVAAFLHAPGEVLSDKTAERLRAAIAQYAESSNETTHG